MKRLKPIAAIYRRLYPSYSTCGCCGLPWDVVKPHFIKLTEYIDFFPVCEWCWQHRKLADIDYAVIKIHREWLQFYEKEGLEMPYDIDEMIEATHMDYKGGEK